MKHHVNLSKRSSMTQTPRTIKDQFPALSRANATTPFVYLDNAASTQKPFKVLEAMELCYRTYYANVHRGLHRNSRESTDAYEAAREAVKRFIKATSTEEIIFTKNATEAFNLVAASLRRSSYFKPGDEIILSIMEHHANIVPWHFLRQECGVVIRWCPVHDDGSLDCEALMRLVTKQTKLISLTMLSNVLGTVVPIREVITKLREHQVYVMVDAAQAAVHLPIDVQQLDCDFLTFTGHKVYGPTGIGVLYGKQSILNAMEPFLGGGEMVDTVTCDHITYQPTPLRFEAGTPPIAEAVGLHAALEWIQDIGFDAIQHHERELKEYTFERLSGVAGLKVFGRAPERAGIFSFLVDSIHAHDLATLLDRYGVAIRSGTHCAMPLLESYRQTALCRASLACYTTKQDIDYFIESLEKARRFFV